MFKDTKFHQLCEEFRASGNRYASIQLFSENEDTDCIDLVNTGGNAYIAQNQANMIPQSHNRHVRPTFFGYPPNTNVYIPNKIKNIAEFSHCVVKYQSVKFKKKENKLLSKSFPKKLRQTLGNDSKKLNNSNFNLSITAGYVNKIACSQARTSKVLIEFLSTMTEHGQIKCAYTNHNIEWSIGNGNRKGTGFISLVQAVFTLSYADAVATAAKILGLNIHHFFNVYTPILRKADKEFALTPINEILPSFLVSAQDGTEKVAQYIKLVPILGFSNQLIGAIAIYSLENEQFCLPASVAYGKLSIGNYRANAYLLNQGLIDANPSATIILCYDMKTAITFDDLLKGLTKDISHEYIVTAHLGEDCSVVDWSYCFGHKVIYVAAPCEDSFECIEECEKFIISADAESFRVYPHLILEKRDVNAYHLGDHEELNQGENFLVINSLYLSEVEHVKIFLENIIKKSLTYQEYRAFWETKGLFFRKKNSATVERASNTLLYSSFKLDSALSDKSSLSYISISDVFPSIALTTIRGPKNGGKSYIVLSFIIWMITGSGFIMGLKSCEGRRVLLIDSETVPSLLSKRIRQMKLAGYFGDSLHVISKEDPSEDNLWKFLDLSNKEDRERIKLYAQENNISYIFCDNLTSLVGDGQMYEPKAMGQIYLWAEELRKNGIGVSLTNHNREDKGQSTLFGKARGSHEFSIRSHTEIVIIGTDEILSNNAWPQAVKDSANKKGITLGLCFKTCKMAAILECKIFWLHLPYDASEWEQIMITDYEGRTIDDFLFENLEIDSVEPVHPVVDEKVDTSNDTLISQSSAPLSKNADGILSYLDANNTTTFKKETIMDALQITDAQFRNATKSLRDYGLIELIENGPASYYLRKK